MNKLWGIFIIVFITSCVEQKQVAGCYNSNFASMGFFGAHLHLNNDSTFNYRFAGDLINRVGHGKYHVNKDTVILLLHRNKSRTSNDILSTDYYLKDTIRFYHQHKNLFCININTGKVVRYAMGYSKHKKYIIFGSRYRTMRYYLKQHPCEVWKY